MSVSVSPAATETPDVETRVPFTSSPPVNVPAKSPLFSTVAVTENGLLGATCGVSTVASVTTTFELVAVSAVIANRENPSDSARNGCVSFVAFSALVGTTFQRLS